MGLALCYFVIVFSVLLALRLPRLGKRELILVLFVRLFDLRLFGLVRFLFPFVSGMGCGLLLLHSLDFYLTVFAIPLILYYYVHCICTHGPVWLIALIKYLSIYLSIFITTLRVFKFDKILRYSVTTKLFR